MFDAPISNLPLAADQHTVKLGPRALQLRL